MGCCWIGLWVATGLLAFVLAIAVRWVAVSRLIIACWGSVLTGVTFLLFQTDVPPLA